MADFRATESPSRQPDLPDDQFRVVFDNSHEAIVIAQDGVLRLANEATARLTGHPPERLVGLPFLELIHPEDHTKVLERYGRRLAGDRTESTLASRIQRASGGYAWCESHSLPTTWGGRPAVLVFLENVTEREGARRQAADVENRLQRIAELAPFFLFIYDYELGRDIYINRSVSRALGYSETEEAELQPYPFLKLCHPDDLEPALDRDERWRGVPIGASRSVEFRLRHRNGDWRWFRSYNTPFLLDAEGRVRQMLGVTEDITDRKRSEESLRRNERLESLGLLAGGIAHDFSNLLTPIVGHAELLRERLGEESPLRDRVLAIEAAAQRATELARQLLVFAGRGEIERRTIDLNALVEEVVHLYGSLARIETPIQLHLAPRLPLVSGDSSQLRQVILNLLTNAQDAVAGDERKLRVTPGRVSIATSRTRLSDVDLEHLLLREGLEAGPVVELRVEDDGTGMESETVTRIGEPFFTTKAKGRGLGLPATLGILRAHRAGIELDTRPGCGTRFRVYFAEAAVPG